VALANRYKHRSPLNLLVPKCYWVNEFVKVVQRLTGITRLPLTPKIGRKTFVKLKLKLKLCRGVPVHLIMQATGHRTEEALSHYVGVRQLQLVEEYMCKLTRQWVERNATLCRGHRSRPHTHF
jgi:hypothetical protein